MYLTVLSRKAISNICSGNLTLFCSFYLNFSNCSYNGKKNLKWLSNGDSTYHESEELFSELWIESYYES